MDYSDWNNELRLHRSELVNQEGRSCVALIEHKLDVARFEALRLAVADEVRRGPPLNDRSWCTRALPLLTVAVEAGYRYGDGSTVYWEAFQEMIGRDLSEQEKQVIPRLIWGLGQVRRPPRVPWADCFRRIAWPISEALLPAWLHAPLLELLQRCPMRIGVDPVGSDRRPYLTWLEEEVGGDGRLSLLINGDRRNLAAALIEGILQDEPVAEPNPVDINESDSRLSIDFIRRARQDVRSSPVTRRIATKVHQAQVRLRTKLVVVTPPPGPVAPRVFGRVDLVVDLATLRLRTAPVRHPALTPDRLRLARAAPLRERVPVMVSELLRAGVTLSSLPAPADQPLMSSRWTTPLGGSLSVALDGLWVDGRRPLLFSERTGPAGSARQVVERAFRACDGWVVLTDHSIDDADGITLLGRIAGGWAHRVDASVPAARAQLEELGLQCVTAPILSMLGAPPLGGATSSDFELTDPVGVRVEGGAVTVYPEGYPAEALAEGMYLVRGPIEAAVTRGGLVNQPTEGSPVLRVLRSMKPRSTEDGPLITLAPGVDASLSSLLTRKIGLVVRAPLGAVGLRARIRVTARGPKGEDISAQGWSQRLGTLPAAVAPTDPVWAALGKLCPVGAALMLSAELPGLGRESWSLSQVDDHRAGHVNVGWSMTEGEDPPTDQGASATQWWPFQAPDAPLRVPPPGVALAAAEDGLFGQAGEVVGPSASNLDDLKFVGLPALPRAPQAARRAFAALWRWRRARSLGGPAALARAAVVRAYDRELTLGLCGAVWLEAEGDLPPTPEPWRQCAEQLMSGGVAWQEGNDPPAQEHLARVRALVEEELRGISRTMFESPPGNPDDRVKFADLIAQMLDRAMRAVGLDQDPPCEEQAVISALGAAWGWRPADEQLAPLASHVLPQSIRGDLLTVVRANLPLPELSAQLGRLIRETSTAVKWTDLELQTLVALWSGERPAGWSEMGELIDQTILRAVHDQRGCRITRLASLARSGGGVFGALS
jgi:hypothetical protein